MDGGSSDAAEDFSAQPAYGAIPPDGGLPDVSSNDGSSNDASSGDASDASHNKDSSIALYGAPPPPSG